MPKPAFPPTDEQIAIIEAARKTTDNLLVNALAGAAKTTTLEFIGHAVTGIPILFVAFNKKIAEEGAKRLPSHVVCKTMNSLGHTAWGSHTGKRLELDKDKLAGIVRGLELTKTEKADLREFFGDVVGLARKAKAFGYVPELPGELVAKSLFTREDFESAVAEEEFDPFAWDLLDGILRTSIKQAYNGLIDFDDQIYMSTLFGAQLPKFPLVLVDEAQDLSPLNHYMVSRLVTKRIIAVGDHFQSIYGFRGAVSDGLSVLRDRFKMRELNLTTTFRCPKRTVERARSRAPLMQAASWAVEGEEHFPTEWDETIFPPRAAIICRNNAPLFSLGLRLLARNRAISMRGFDISKRIVKVLKDFGPGDMPREEVLLAIRKWKQSKLDEGKLAPESVHDRAACLEVFARRGVDLASAVAVAEELFKQEGPLELMSGHKSKGLEFDHVFHLDPWRVPSRFTEPGTEAYNQELNLQYVIWTRVKQTYTEINLDDFVET